MCQNYTLSRLQVITEIYPEWIITQKSVHYVFWIERLPYAGKTSTYNFPWPLTWEAVFYWWFGNPLGCLSIVSVYAAVCLFPLFFFFCLSLSLSLSPTFVIKTVSWGFELEAYRKKMSQAPLLTLWPPLCSGIVLRLSPPVAISQDKCNSLPVLFLFVI